VRLTTLDNIDITGVEQFHKKNLFTTKSKSLNQFSSTDKLRDRTTRLVNILLRSNVLPPPQRQFCLLCQNSIGSTVKRPSALVRGNLETFGSDNMHS